MCEQSLGIIADYFVIDFDSPVAGLMILLQTWNISIKQNYFKIAKFSNQKINIKCTEPKFKILNPDSKPVIGHVLGAWIISHLQIPHLNAQYIYVFLDHLTEYSSKLHFGSYWDRLLPQKGCHIWICRRIQPLKNGYLPIYNHNCSHLQA